MPHKILVFISSFLSPHSAALQAQPQYLAAIARQRDYTRDEIDDALAVFHACEDKFWRAAYPHRRPPGMRAYTNQPAKS